jgi:hypothetical protein
VSTGSEVAWGPIGELSSGWQPKAAARKAAVSKQESLCCFIMANLSV